MREKFLTAREFVALATGLPPGGEKEDTCLMALSEYRANSAYYRNIAYDHFPDEHVNGIELDPEEPHRFLRYLEECGIITRDFTVTAADGTRWAVEAPLGGAHYHYVRRLPDGEWEKTVWSVFCENHGIPNEEE